MATEHTQPHTQPLNLSLMGSLYSSLEDLDDDGYEQAAINISREYKSPVDQRNWGLSEYVRAFILAIGQDQPRNLTCICTAWAQHIMDEHNLQGENIRPILERYAPDTQIDIYFIRAALEIRRYRSDWPSAEHIRELVYYHVATEHGGERVDFYRVFQRWPNNDLQMQYLPRLRYMYQMKEGHEGTLEELKTYSEQPGIIEKLQLSVEYNYIFGEWPTNDLQCQCMAELRIRYHALHNHQGTVDELKEFVQQPGVLLEIKFTIEYHYIYDEWPEDATAATALAHLIELKEQFRTLHGHHGTLQELRALADHITHLAIDPEGYHQDNKVYVGLPDISKLPEVKADETSTCGWCQDKISQGQIVIQLPCKCSLSLYHTSGCLEGSTIRTWFTSHKTCPGCRSDISSLLA